MVTASAHRGWVVTPELWVDAVWKDDVVNVNPWLTFMAQVPWACGVWSTVGVLGCQV